VQKKESEMEKSIKTLLTLASILAVTGCATVRQQDLDAWVGMPVEALETHSFFVTVPLYKTKTESGIEIWNYANGADVASCYGNAFASGSNRYVSANSFSTCSSNRIVCNNLFYIKDKKVLEYKPSGQCMTNETVQPEGRFKKLTGK
jgi:hypothetical protein